jgi:hypothetical protein
LSECLDHLTRSPGLGQLMKAARETDPSQPKQEAAYNNEKDLADAWGQGHRVVSSPLSSA